MHKLLPTQLNNHKVANIDTSQEKNYRIKDDRWYCERCSIYCNSDSQYQVHMMSTKHKLGQANTQEADTTTASSSSNSNGTSAVQTNQIDEVSDKLSTLDIKDNSLARNCNVDAAKYFIPQELKVGKYQKFGFYCPLCKVYMTGQIQLIMHVKGAKHQYLSPNEIPGYVPSKQYDPNKGRRRHLLRFQNSKSIPQTPGLNNSFSSNHPFNEHRAFLNHSITHSLYHHHSQSHQQQHHNHHHQHQHGSYLQSSTCSTPPNTLNPCIYFPSPQHYNHQVMKRDASSQINPDQLNQYAPRYTGVYNQPLNSYFTASQPLFSTNGLYTTTSTPSPMASAPTPPILSNEINNNYLKQQQQQQAFMNEANRQLAVNYKNFSNTILPALQQPTLNLHTMMQKQGIIHK